MEELVTIRGHLVHSVVLRHQQPSWPSLCQAETQAAAAVYAVMMCGHTTPELEAEWGDYGDMAIELLRDANRDEKWLKFNVVDDEFPEEQQWQTFKASTLF